MDKKYWERFYENNSTVSVPRFPSSFAEFCLTNFISSKDTVIELGAGNGRDAIFFGVNGLRVYAIDQSTVQSERHLANQSADVADRVVLIKQDFTLDSFSDFRDANVFYSRFTMHAIDQDGEDRLLLNVFNGLPEAGLLLIETRTTKDPLYGQGEKLDDNVYMTDHRRRFIDSRAFLEKCTNMAFKLRYFDERSGLSVLGEDNPVLMRIVLEK